MRTRSVLAAAAALLALAPQTASADEAIIKSPGDHPSYSFEAEPHALVGFAGPFEKGKGSFGAGFRGTVVIVDNGFIKSINNSVGIGFGADFFFGSNVFFIPVVMQWNFWLSSHWSVFGEPGVGFAANPGPGRDAVHPVFGAGGRFHFNDKIALTLRLGYPEFTAGVSFLF